MALNNLKYRAEIDGLRAVAVLSVVIYHFFPEFIKSGFIGVDIFFVISGFLITTIIVEGFDGAKFSLVDFYSRRIRRIFPALLAVLIVSLMLGYIVLFSGEFKQLGEHVLGGATFLSNFILWGESGYFDTSASTKVLLHLWSLAVEEQFYILFPALLYAAWRLRLNLLAVVFLIACVSFGINIWQSQVDQVADFYSPWTRFWELMVGSILACLQTNGLRFFQVEKNKAKYENISAVLGVVLLATGYFVITKESAFPGYWALFPTIGAALIIAGGSHAWVNRLLSNRFLVWVGLISFPLYLWHWVLLAFSNIIAGGESAQEVRFGLVVVSILLSWLTFKYIEKPLRHGSGNVTIALTAVMVLIGFIGYAINKGFILPSSQEGKNGEISFDKEQIYYKEHFFPCTPKGIYDDAVFGGLKGQCFQSKIGVPIDLAIWGDSHAEHLFVGLAEALPQKNVVFYARSGHPGAFAEHAKVIHYLREDLNIKSVILSGYWGIDSTDGYMKNMMAGLDAAIPEISSPNRKIYIADDVPNFTFSPSVCKQARVRFFVGSRSSTCFESKERFLWVYHLYIDVLLNVKKNHPEITIINSSQYFIDDENVFMADGNELYYRDNNHLNYNGSRYLAKKMLKDHPELSQ